MYRAQVHGRHILLVGIEDHVPGHAVVLINIGQRIVNPRAIQSGLANRIQQRIHRVKCECGKLFRRLMEARFKAPVEIEPARVLAARVIRKDRFKSLCRRAGFSQQAQVPSVR